MTTFLLVVSIANVALHIVIYRRAPSRDVGPMDYRAAAAVSGLLWLLITAWCVVQLSAV